jgi:ParB family chromosome partitioning protein
MEVIDVSLAKITVLPNRRRPKPAAIKAMADSILAVGLQHPIGVVADGGGYRLVYGRTRLEGCVELGKTKIAAVVHDYDDLHAELAELDENLQRTELTALEQSKALARRKQIYEAIHPETKRGGAPGKPGGGKKAKDDNMSSFAADTAAKTGSTSRTVQRDVALANSIPDDVAEKIANTPVADNKAELKALGKLPEAQQRDVAERLASGEIDRVPKPCRNCGGLERDEDGDCAKCREPIEPSPRAWPCHHCGGSHPIGDNPCHDPFWRNWFAALDDWLNDNPDKAAIAAARLENRAAEIMARL